jgi:phosphatidylglycerophosphate synthase
MLHKMHRFPPSVWGKASTFVQISLALFILLRNAAAGMTPAEVPDPIIWAVAALTAFSGIHYIWRGIRELQSGPSAAIDGGLARE